MNLAIESAFELRLLVTGNNNPVILTHRVSDGKDRLLQIVASGWPVGPHSTRGKRNQKNYCGLLSHPVIPAISLVRPSMNSFFKAGVTKRVRRRRPKNIRTVCVPSDSPKPALFSWRRQTAALNETVCS